MMSDGTSLGAGAALPQAPWPTEATTPVALQALRQWITWRLEPPFKPGDKWRKVPYCSTTGRYASTTDPKTWGTFDEALTAARKRKMTGIGFVFTEGDRFCGIDLDNCRCPETGKIAQWAVDIIANLNTYTEISASGTGVHLIAEAELPPTGRKSEHLEMYESGRYFAFTGLSLKSTLPEPQARQAEVAALHATHFQHTNGTVAAESNVIPLSYDDAKIIEMVGRAKNAPKFYDLWRGQWHRAGFKSQSEADLALVGILKFYTQDAAQIDRLFRKSDLMRAKWDTRRGDQTYGQQTIQYSLDRGGEVYTPPSTPVHVNHRQADDSKAESESDAESDDEEESDIHASPWPDPPDDDAYHGPAGAFVELVEPCTEADPVAILMQTLVSFGNLIGRGPHFVAEASNHYTNLFTVLVGATAKGRKGSSWGHVYNLCEAVDEEWASKRKLSGLSSGEGLIWEVRDPIHKREMVKQRGKDSTYEDVEADPGVSDKRLLAFEGEFAAALKVMGRQGNTLSTTIRQAWDDGDLNTMVKNSPGRATSAHISIIGHVTKDELLRDLAATETSNGFANRFLWVCVRRSKCLPEGNDAQGLNLAGLVARFKAAADFAYGIPQMRRDDEAREIWREIYPDLSEGKPGLFGLVTSRAEAQVMRLACIYALLDRSVLIRVAHLRAALALWRYCESSCRWIFGDSLGDPTADEILKALRAQPRGLARTDIRDLFGRHKNRAEITRGLTMLVKNGLARVDKIETGGRPCEWWQAIGVRAQ